MIKMITYDELSRLPFDQLMLAYIERWGSCESKLNKSDLIDHFIGTEKQIIVSLTDPLLKKILKEKLKNRMRKDIIEIDRIVRKYIKKSKEEKSVENILH